MNFSKKGYSIEEIKEMDMVDYLSKLGYKPVKVRSADYWYLSPLRDEKTSSFKVNKKLNKWYDHGLGEGGNLIDFGILYHHCSVSDFLQKINNDFFFHQPVIHQQAQGDPEHKITIIQDFFISSVALLKYLEQRRIPIDIAAKYCREVQYDLNGKTYYGIGFKNDSGGYEIRNPYFKASSSPKDVTTFNNDSKEVLIFEGFFDFLSFIAIHPSKPKINTNFLILNSISFFEKARPFMEQHETVKLYLDRDTTGQKYRQYALSLSKKYKDESSLYNNYKDLNEWLVNSGMQQKRQLKQRL